MIKDNMTTQEVFDHVVTHLRQQGCQAKGEDNACSYRGANNLRCAVGCLIKDEEYNELFERRSISNLMPYLSDNNQKVLFDRLYPHMDLLEHLQRVHDLEGADMTYWERMFVNLANRFNLTVPPAS